MIGRWGGGRHALRQTVWYPDVELVHEFKTPLSKERVWESHLLHCASAAAQITDCVHQQSGYYTLLMPTFSTSALKWSKPQTKTIKVWTCNSVESLEGCFLY